MRTRAAVAIAPGKPLEIMEVNLEGPKAGEVLVEIKATGICHTDEFTLSGADPEGIFPSILGHEGAGVVVDVGPGVTSVKKGDHVIPLYTPECRNCKSCLSQRTNLCTAIRSPWITFSPMPPRPKTTAFAPISTFAVLITAPMPVVTPQPM